MKIAFTICSNNYLAQAKALGDSICKYNNEYVFYIGLADTISESINYKENIPYSIILLENIGIHDIDRLWKKYSIIEFCTSIKPFYISYFLREFTNIEFIFYLDPDTYFYDNISLIEDEFNDDKRVLLSPHILTPIDFDGKRPFENDFLKYGIYNLGFLGLKNPRSSLHLLKWWEMRTYNFCFCQPDNGFFVDQLWFNLVPILFEHTSHSKNVGLNVAPWNLHERYISIKKNKYVVNSNTSLIFYHFSNFNFSNPVSITLGYDRYTLIENELLKKLYLDYYNILLENGIIKYSEIECFYMSRKREYLGIIEKDRESKLRELLRKSPIKRIKYLISKKIAKKYILIYKILTNKYIINNN